jgi:3-hydroxybutyryl-CoA dehydratase
MQQFRGLWFEQFEEGMVVESAGRTITEADVVGFASLSGDWNQMHTDAEYCKTTMYGQRVAHGLLVLSVASGLAMRLGFMEQTVKAFMGLSWKFRAPVFIGDTVHLRATVTKKHPMRQLGGGVVTFNVEVLNQDNRVVQRGEWEVIVASMPAADSGPAPAGSAA